MGIANKYNTGAKFEQKAKEDVTYYTLKELGASDIVYKLRALYINTKSKYGDAPVALIDDCDTLVNLPSHLLSTVKTMMNDTDFVNSVNKGLVGFTIYKYSGKNGNGFSVNWKDLVADTFSDSDVPF